jgi:hypothetical protein
MIIFVPAMVTVLPTGPVVQDSYGGGGTPMPRVPVLVLKNAAGVGSAGVGVVIAPVGIEMFVLNNWSLLGSTRVLVE